MSTIISPFSAAGNPLSELRPSLLAGNYVMVRQAGFYGLRFCAKQTGWSALYLATLKSTIATVVAVIGLPWYRRGR
jgi:hypothetical protein